MKLKHLSQIVILCGLVGLPVFAQNSNSENEHEKWVDYQQHHRPQLHFSPKQGWMNDPNGMVYHNGEYHLFFQHYPDGTQWNTMHWGHAVSKDLTHWQELPIALHPDEKGWIYSGSAVLDKDNTSGLGTTNNPPLVAIFTYHDKKAEAVRGDNVQTQALAYSLDNGRSWQKYHGNPVLEGGNIADFRDPKVFWHEESEQWVMALAVQNRIGFYGSENLKNWQHLSDFGAEFGAHGGYWECPDLIKMQVEGSDEEKYVLLVSLNPGGPNGGSGTQYFVGDFDGKVFTLDTEFEKSVTKIPARFPQDTIFENFESDLSQWQKQGNAFNQSPVVADENQFIGKFGAKLANSFNTGDDSTGKLISQPFTIEQAFINFVIAGGKYADDAAINLIVDEKTVASATGNNSGAMVIKSWNVSQWQGQTAHLEIVDNATGPWGHISVDQIVFSDTQAKPATEPAVWLDYGADNYAGVTWSGIEDDRHLFIGWMNNWAYANEVPTDQWRGAMTLPRELKLAKTPSGYRVKSLPLNELKQVAKQSAEGKNLKLNNAVSLNQLANMQAELFELDLTIEMRSATQFRLEIGNQLNEKVILLLDTDKQTVSLDRRFAGQHRFDEDFAMVQSAPLAIENQYQIKLIQDVASTEIFINQGEVTLTSLVFPNKPLSLIKLESDKESLITQWKLTELSSIWR
ncbi:glycoside hydrolase family 32 protein [Catenovulum adriaticum]|uniref:GH32 C-terminal domain-containing protein n=1 Tax=Catenovulum adriaticum TaxID=2984846 RepID=A0ABY7ATY2_9ALTE|nr:glycoside hydrolase family 32 protein [Catenovulum sp. TS8]WAJ71980.1 GH32 C-terminal domain-containing protein [Catenovulum sp. TS8]